MEDKNKTKGQLLSELAALRQRVAKLEASEVDLKRAEEALRERGERLQTLIENSLDAVAVLNGDGTVRYQSQSMSMVLGYESNAVVAGANAFDYLHPEDKPTAAQLLKKVKKNPGIPLHAEIRAKHKDGSWRTLELVLRNLLDDPIVGGILANFWDITERKQAEAILKDSEEQFRSLIENAADAITLLTADGIVIYQSPSIERLAGYNPNDIVGTPIHQYIHPDNLPAVVASFTKVIKTPGATESLEVLLRRVDGTWCCLEGVAKNLLDDPRVGAVVCNFHDITERKQAEESLRERGERLQAFIENSLDNVAILNSDGTIRYQSPSLGQVLGYESADETGRSAIDFLHPEDKPVAEQFLEQLRIHPDTPVHSEFRTMHSNGSWHTLEVVLRNLLEDPIVGGILANFRDITERKLTEESRIKHAAALAKAEELKRSRQRIVTVQESLRRDIAQQVHGSVQNRLIILLHRLADLERKAQTKEMAAELSDLHQKLASLIEDQVRPISHRLYPSILRRGLVVALQSLVDQFELTLNIEMELDQEILRQERTTPRMMPEQVRLATYRIAEEALTNVVKHAKNSQITVRLESLSEKWARLVIRDSGPGFVTENASAGIGILMMQDYGEVAGGNCVIRSVPSKGTEVVVTFPLSGPDAAPQEKTPPSE